MDKNINKRVFSGIQPTGNLHLGNYLGAIKNWIPLQDKYECVYCIVDLHAMTVYQEPEHLKQAIYETAACFLACGVDASKHIILCQSFNHHHAELAWLLNCVARIGWLNRMTQFKEKTGKNKEQASLGLYAYPVLMAADILAYQSTHVPVGEDQKQHIELARDIAIKFNADYAGRDFFTLPEPIIPKQAMRIMSLRDGTKKMSKSDPSEYSRICLQDDADTLALKIRKAKTDTEEIPLSFDALEGRAEAKNLLTIYQAMTGLNDEALFGQFGGKNFKFLKEALTEVLIESLVPIASEIQKLMEDTSYLDGILKKGGERAAKITEPCLREVKSFMGLIS